MTIVSSNSREQGCIPRTPVVLSCDDDDDATSSITCALRIFRAISAAGYDAVDFSYNFRGCGGGAAERNFHNPRITARVVLCTYNSILLLPANAVLGGEGHQLVPGTCTNCSSQGSFVCIYKS